jgi:hypothetical protein
MPTNTELLLTNFHYEYSREEKDHKTAEEYRESMLKGKVQQLDGSMEELIPWSSVRDLSIATEETGYKIN